MRFDSTKAWKDASAAVAKHRELMFALAGVFFLLPSFAMNLLVPKFEPQAGLPPRVMIDQLGAFYASILPYAIVITLLQLVGTLTILTLFTDRTRPTVGEAIKLGGLGVLPCLAAQLLIGLGIGMGFMLLVALGSVSGSGAVMTLLILVGIGAAIWFWTQFSLVPPVVAVERAFNPIAALRRSWQLMRGNVGRVMLFYALLLIAFGAIALITMLVLGTVFAMALPAEGARIASALISSVLTAVLALYLVAVLAAVHRQLAGPSADATARTFD